ncbi:hypothetical protein TNCV_4272411 [Trichonephila clavipes]|nr:hypothetical protein TNCV_4272411 [Trichonephila clavipes]
MYGWEVCYSYSTLISCVVVFAVEAYEIPRTKEIVLRWSLAAALSTMQHTFSLTYNDGVKALRYAVHPVQWLVTPSSVPWAWVRIVVPVKLISDWVRDQKSIPLAGASRIEEYADAIKTVVVRRGNSGVGLPNKRFKSNYILIQNIECYVTLKVEHREGVAKLCKFRGKRSRIPTMRNTSSRR